jgi:hypothetical protein
MPFLFDFFSLVSLGDVKKPAAALPIEPHLQGFKGDFMEEQR